MKNYYILALLIAQFTVFAQGEWLQVPNVPANLATRKINILPDGEVWLGTYNNGALRLVNNSWITYDVDNSDISNNDVREISKDSEGNYWMATWSNLSKFNPTANTWEIFNVTGEIYDILLGLEIDSAGRIWVGADGGSDEVNGLYLWNTGEFFNSDNSVLGSNYIPAIETDSEGHVFVCNKSIVEIDGVNMTATPLTDIGFLSNVTTTAIDFTSSNHIWASIYDGGIAYFNGVTWTVYTADNSGLPENKIWCLTVDKNDNVWLGTENFGLVKFDGVTWTVFNTSNSPLTNNRIDALNCDALNNIWVAPNYGGIFLFNQEGVASVSGTAYYDLNSNNTYEAGDIPVRNAVVTLTPGDYYAATDSQGNYRVGILEAGNYTVTATPANPYIQDVTPASIGVSVTEDFVPVVQNFAVHLMPGVNDVLITGTAVNAARPGFTTTYAITVRNTGTLPIQDIGIAALLDENLILVSASDNPVITGQNLNWIQDFLDVDEEKVFTVEAFVPPEVDLLGTIIETPASCFVENDSNTNNDFTSIFQTIVGSYDPNDKNVSPAGIGPQGNIPLETEVLDYTIRFQNTGTFEAWRVVITDEISPLLDISTFQTIAASHDYNITFEQGGIAKWTFNNISLPHSAADEPGSHGFVRFTIQPKADVEYGDVVSNIALIYFDYNPPIITNETVNRFHDFSMDVDENNLNRLVIYPNPARSAFSIATSGIQFPLTVHLYDSLGKLVQQTTINNLNTSISTENLTSGIVYYKVYSEDGKLSGEGKLVIN